MSDLGSDAGSTSLSLMAKILEAILQLISKIYEAHQNALERKLTQLKVKEAKTESEKRDAIKKLDGKTGYVNHKLIQKSGEPLSTNLLTLTKEEMKQFSAICKREGVLFSAVTNAQLKKDGEKAIYAIECRQSDVEKLRAAVDRFNDEKRIAMIDERMKTQEWACPQGLWEYKRSGQARSLPKPLLQWRKAPHTDCTVPEKACIK